jgi:hypothetical protein
MPSFHSSRHRSMLVLSATSVLQTHYFEPLCMRASTVFVITSYAHTTDMMKCACVTKCACVIKCVYVAPYFK